MRPLLQVCLRPMCRQTIWQEILLDSLRVLFRLGGRTIRFHYSGWWGKATGKHLTLCITGRAGLLAIQVKLTPRAPVHAC